MESSRLPHLVEALCENYRGHPIGQRIERQFLPSRDEILRILELSRQLLYPGYLGRQDLTQENVAFHVGGLLAELRSKLCQQIEQCLCHAQECDGRDQMESGASPCAAKARATTDAFLTELPILRTALLQDADAALEGDPAASNIHEVILTYPGFLAVTVYRIAHCLHLLEVPLMPRMMTEWAHGETGADLHPGASIGSRFFIDHATGVVVGGTSKIGSGVRLYQGVTLGALSLPRDDKGHVLRNVQRHPTVEDNVTIYANATILGGKTVVGQGSVVGGSVFLTRSVPSFARVAVRSPDLRVNVVDRETLTEELPLDFDI